METLTIRKGGIGDMNGGKLNYIPGNAKSMSSESFEKLRRGVFITVLSNVHSCMCSVYVGV